MGNVACDVAGMTGSHEMQRRMCRRDGDGDEREGRTRRRRRRDETGDAWDVGEGREAMMDRAQRKARVDAIYRRHEEIKRDAAKWKAVAQDGNRPMVDRKEAHAAYGKLVEESKRLFAELEALGAYRPKEAKGAKGAEGEGEEGDEGEGEEGEGEGEGEEGDDGLAREEAKLLKSALATGMTAIRNLTARSVATDRDRVVADYTKALAQITKKPERLVAEFQESVACHMIDKWAEELRTSQEPQATDLGRCATLLDAMQNEHTLQESTNGEWTCSSFRSQGWEEYYKSISGPFFLRCVKTRDLMDEEQADAYAAAFQTADFPTDWKSQFAASWSEQKMARKLAKQINEARQDYGKDGRLNHAAIQKIRRLQEGIREDAIPDKNHLDQILKIGKAVEDVENRIDWLAPSSIESSAEPLVLREDIGSNVLLAPAADELRKKLRERMKVLLDARFEVLKENYKDTDSEATRELIRQRTVQLNDMSDKMGLPLNAYKLDKDPAIAARETRETNKLAVADAVRIVHDSFVNGTFETIENIRVKIEDFIKNYRALPPDDRDPEIKRKINELEEGVLEYDKFHRYITSFAPADDVSIENDIRLTEMIKRIKNVKNEKSMELLITELNTKVKARLELRKKYLLEKYNEDGASQTKQDKIKGLYNKLMELYALIGDADVSEPLPDDKETTERKEKEKTRKTNTETVDRVYASYMASQQSAAADIAAIRKLHDQDPADQLPEDRSKLNALYIEYALSDEVDRLNAQLSSSDSFEDNRDIKRVLDKLSASASSSSLLPRTTLKDNAEKAVKNKAVAIFNELKGKFEAAATELDQRKFANRIQSLKAFMTSIGLTMVETTYYLGNDVAMQAEALCAQVGDIAGSLQNPNFPVGWQTTYSNMFTDMHVKYKDANAKKPGVCEKTVGTRGWDGFLASVENGFVTACLAHRAEMELSPVKQDSFDVQMQFGFGQRLTQKYMADANKLTKSATLTKEINDAYDKYVSGGVTPNVGPLRLRAEARGMDVDKPALVRLEKLEQERAKRLAWDMFRSQMLGMNLDVMKDRVVRMVAEMQPDGVTDFSVGRQVALEALKTHVNSKAAAMQTSLAAEYIETKDPKRQEAIEKQIVHVREVVSQLNGDIDKVKGVDVTKRIDARAVGLCDKIGATINQLKNPDLEGDLAWVKTSFASLDTEYSAVQSMGGACKQWPNWAATVQATYDDFWAKCKEYRASLSASEQALFDTRIATAKIQGHTANYMTVVNISTAQSTFETNVATLYNTYVNTGDLDPQTLDTLEREASTMRQGKEPRAAAAAADRLKDIRTDVNTMLAVDRKIKSLTSSGDFAAKVAAANSIAAELNKDTPFAKVREITKPTLQTKLEEIATALKTRYGEIDAKGYLMTKTEGEEQASIRKHLGVLRESFGVGDTDVTDVAHQEGAKACANFAGDALTLSSARVIYATHISEWADVHKAMIRNLEHIVQRGVACPGIPDPRKHAKEAETKFIEGCIASRQSLPDGEKVAFDAAMQTQFGALMGAYNIAKDKTDASRKKRTSTEAAEALCKSIVDNINRLHQDLEYAEVRKIFDALQSAVTELQLGGAAAAATCGIKKPDEQVEQAKRDYFDRLKKQRESRERDGDNDSAVAQFDEGVRRGFSEDDVRKYYTAARDLCAEFEAQLNRIDHAGDFTIGALGDHAKAIDVLHALTRQVPDAECKHSRRKITKADAEQRAAESLSRFFKHCKKLATAREEGMENDAYDQAVRGAFRPYDIDVYYDEIKPAGPDMSRCVALREKGGAFRRLPITIDSLREDGALSVAWNELMDANNAIEPSDACAKALGQSTDLYLAAIRKTAMARTISVLNYASDKVAFSEAVLTSFMGGWPEIELFNSKVAALDAVAEKKARDEVAKAEKKARDEEAEAEKKAKVEKTEAEKKAQAEKTEAEKKAQAEKTEAKRVCSDKRDNLKAAIAKLDKISFSPEKEDRFHKVVAAIEKVTECTAGVQQWCVDTSVDRDIEHAGDVIAALIDQVCSAARKQLKLLPQDGVTCAALDAKLIGQSTLVQQSYQQFYDTLAKRVYEDEDDDGMVAATVRWRNVNGAVVELAKIVGRWYVSLETLKQTMRSCQASMTTNTALRELCMLDGLTPVLFTEQNVMDFRPKTKFPDIAMINQRISMDLEPYASRYYRDGIQTSSIESQVTDVFILLCIVHVLANKHPDTGPANLLAAAMQTYLATPGLNYLTCGILYNVAANVASRSDLNVLATNAVMRAAPFGVPQSPETVDLLLQQGLPVFLSIIQSSEVTAIDVAHHLFDTVYVSPWFQQDQGAVLEMINVLKLAFELAVTNVANIGGSAVPSDNVLVRIVSMSMVEVFRTHPHVFSFGRFIQYYYANIFGSPVTGVESSRVKTLAELEVVWNNINAYVLAKSEVTLPAAIGQSLARCFEYLLQYYEVLAKIAMFDFMFTYDSKQNTELTWRSGGGKRRSLH